MKIMDLFLLKKIISALIMPLSIVIILLIIAIILHRKKPQFSFKCLLLSTFLLIVTSMGPFADWVMKPIEDNYPVYTKNPLPIDYIIVLGCGHTSDNALPATSQLKACSLQRLVEAVRIYQLHPEATIITSGHAFGDPMSNAMKVKEAAVSLGIPAEKIITENFPKDTEEEAELIAPRVKDHQSILITNADHMPRAIQYFAEQGAYPIAAPTSHYVKDNKMDKHWGYFIPNSDNLTQTTTAWYETLGRVVQQLKQLTN